MADGLNRVMVMGNLGQDPELRVTGGGQSVMRLSLGCNESWLDKNRVRQERVEWIRVVIWGRRAEGLAKFLAKGMQVFVEGKMQTSSYEDKEGVRRYSTEVIARNIIVNGGSRARNAPRDPERRGSRRDHYDNSDTSDRQNQNQNQNYDDHYGGGGGFDGGGDDDIPF